MSIEDQIKYCEMIIEDIYSLGENLPYFICTDFKEINKELLDELVENLTEFGNKNIPDFSKVTAFNYRVNYNYNLCKIDHLKKYIEHLKSQS